MFLLRYSLLSIACLSGLAATARLVRHDASFSPDYTLHVTYQNATAACRSKPLALVNGQSPGPPLTLQEGRTTWVRVYNDMSLENLTIHWHGLSQAAAPFSDGTPQASQWPIKAGQFFDYEIQPAAGEAGTYFYHSHVGFQAVSAAGPLIVKEANSQPPYRYDAERVMFVSEFYNLTQTGVINTLSTSPYSWPGETETFLINGKSYVANDGQVSRAPTAYMYNSSTFGTCGPDVFEVEPGRTYRFRSIGGTALSLVSFAFEDHDNLTVIAADASYTKPATTDHIQVGPGQRIDFLLRTKTAEELAQLNKTMFWIQYESRLRPTNVTSYAILKYNTTQHKPQQIPASPPAKQPIALSDQVQYWLEYDLQPLTPNNFPSASEVTRRVYLSSAQLISQSGTQWSVNNHTWTEGDEHLHGTAYNDTRPNVGTPYLVNVYQKGEAAIPNYNLSVSKYGGWDPNLNVYVAKVGEVIEIVLQNDPNGHIGGFDAHPWHIHGGHIYDIGSGPGAYNPSANEKKLQGRHPVVRDTTYLYKYTDGDALNVPSYSVQGWRAWRLRVGDAGVWMVHCHILQHMITGMQSVWVMGNASQITHSSEPYVRGYLQFGGSAYGNASYDPLVYHHYD